MQRLQQEPQTESRSITAAIRWPVSACGLAGIVLLFHRWLHVNQTTVALTLLLYVLLLAAEWGLRYALAVSVAATLCYNFFFLPPLNTLNVADPQNWIALLAFLATSLIASRLSQKARDEARDARSRQRELAILFSLSRELLATETVSALLSAAPAAVASAVAAEECVLYLLEGDKIYQADSTASDIEPQHFRALASQLYQVSRQGDVLQIPLRSGTRTTGLLLLTETALTLETAEAIGSLISLALDRSQALEDLARGEAAKESERMRNLMMDSITHELRTPLTSIKGAATALLSKSSSVSDDHDLLCVIDEESDRLDRLIAEAMEMAQLDSQQVQMESISISVDELVEEALKSCSWVKEDHSVTLHVPTGLFVKGDPAFLSKVLCNLVENAAKYSERNTSITLSAQRREAQVLISIADQGIGIEPAEQNLVFERFYRARTHSERVSGTGMGLAISRAIVEAHGGTLTVVSQPGRGSVFTFSLPVAEAEPA